MQLCIKALPIAAHAMHFEALCPEAKLSLKFTYTTFLYIKGAIPPWSIWSWGLDNPVIYCAQFRCWNRSKKIDCFLSAENIYHVRGDLS